MRRPPASWRSVVPSAVRQAKPQRARHVEHADRAEGRVLPTGREQEAKKMDTLWIRPIEIPADGEALERLDTGLTTDRVYDVAVDDDGFHLRAHQVPPVTKRYPLEDWREPTPPWEVGWLAWREGRPVGFAAVRFERWNRRLVIWHLYVDRPARRSGVARALLETATDWGRRRGAHTAWLEVSTVNYPAVQAYRALGYQLSGLDLTLYRGTDAAGEAALFMTKSLQP